MSDSYVVKAPLSCMDESHAGRLLFYAHDISKLLKIEGQLCLKSCDHSVNVFFIQYSQSDVV